MKNKFKIGDIVIVHLFTFQKNMGKIIAVSKNGYMVDCVSFTLTNVPENALRNVNNESFEI